MVGRRECGRLNRSRTGLEREQTCRDQARGQLILELKRSIRSMRGQEASLGIAIKPEIAVAPDVEEDRSFLDERKSDMRLKREIGHARQRAGSFRLPRAQRSFVADRERVEADEFLVAPHDRPVRVAAGGAQLDELDCLIAFHDILLEPHLLRRR